MRTAKLIAYLPGEDHFNLMAQVINKGLLAGMTQREISLNAGISEVTLCNWINCRGIANFMHLMKLAEAVGYPLRKVLAFFGYDNLD